MIYHEGKYAVFNYLFTPRTVKASTEDERAIVQTQALDIPGMGERKNRMLARALQEYLLDDYEEEYPDGFADLRFYPHRQMEEDVLGCVMRGHYEKLDSHFSHHIRRSVVIDNRPKMQRILIDARRPSYLEIDYHLLERALNRALEETPLQLKLYPVWPVDRFYQMVAEHPNGFRKIKFHFPPLNLERLQEVLDAYLTLARKEFGASIDLTLEAPEGCNLNLDDNKPLKHLIEGAAAAGVPIILYPVAVHGEKSSPLHCGKGMYYNLPLDTLEQLNQIPNIPITKYE